MEHIDLVDTSVELAAGDVLLAYTDGVTEARAPDGEFYGEVRILGHVATSSGDPSDIARSLLAEVLAFQQGVTRDDIAIVTLRIR